MVQTDVVLHYDAVSEFESKPASYVLRSETGEQVLLDVQLTEKRYVELKPVSALRPHTHYTLEASWYLRNGQSDSKLSFETGDGPLEQIPEAPRAVMHQYKLGASSRSSCGPANAGACVSVANDDTWIEYSMLDELDRARPPVLVRGSFMLSGTYHCLELRVRAANGNRSQPLRLCTDDAPISDLSASAAEPELLCASAGMYWCEANGSTGSALGVDASPTELPDLPCVPTASKQSAQLQQAGGSAPASANVPAAESGCSVQSTAAHDQQGLAMFATLGMLLLRRTRRWPLVRQA